MTPLKNQPIMPLLILLIIILSSVPTPIQAHQVQVFAWQAGEIVTVESKFSGGRPLVKGQVDVQHATTGASLYQGRTNDQGHFSFSLADTVKAEKAPLRIIVSGGDGHRNEWLLQPEVAHVSQETDQAATTVPAAELSGTAGSVSNKELTIILERLLEEKLAPIRRSLAQSQEPRPKLTDILGGIGYLIGLAGIIAWIKSRK